MLREEINALIAVRDAVREGRSCGRLNVSRYGAWFCNMIFLLLADAKDIAPCEELCRIAGKGTNRNSNSFELAVYHMLTGKSEEMVCAYISAMLKDPHGINMLAFMNSPALLETAYVLGYHNVVRAAARYTLRFSGNMLLEAVNRDDTGFIREVTDGGRLLAEYCSEGGNDPVYPYKDHVEVTFNNYVNVYSVLHNILAESIVCAAAENAPDPRRVLETIGKAIGGKTAAEALVYCLGEYPEAGLSRMMLVLYTFYCRAGSFGSPCSGADMPERLRRLRGLSEVIAETGIAPLCVTDCLEIAFSRSYEIDICGYIEAMLPIMPDKLILSRPYIKKEHIALLKEKYGIEPVFMFRDFPDGTNYSAEYTVSFVRMIRDNMKILPCSAESFSEKGILSALLCPKFCKTLRELVSAGAFDSGTVSVIIDRCVKERRFKTLDMLSGVFAQPERPRDKPA